MNWKRIFVAVCFAALAAVSVSQTRTQRGFRWRTPSVIAGNPTVLLDRDDVRSDLRLSDDQRVKLDELRFHLMGEIRTLFANRTPPSDTVDPAQQQEEIDTRRKQFQALAKEGADKAQKVLTAAQRKRLQEIAVQLTGNSAALNPEIQKDLSLSSDQKDKIADLAQKASTATRTAYGKVFTGDITMDAAQATGAKNEQILAEQIGKVLTEPQRTKLKDLSGRPFKADKVSEDG